MRYLVAGLLASLSAVLAGSARADVRTGIAAYARGDYPRAMREFEAAAEKGDPQALYNLGVAHAEGKAVPADRAKAVDLYRQAAGRGSVLAAFNLGQAYRKGEGVAADFAEAARWYRMAAEGGHYKAAGELGILYVEGRGVPKDPVEGFAWIYTGTHASIMDDSALANATKLASMLTRDQVQEGQKRGQDYHKRYIAAHPAVVRALMGR